MTDKIYIESKKPITTPLELIKELYSYEEDDEEDGENYLKSCITYKDPEFKTIDCYSNKYRSLEDVFAIFKTYFPKITEKEILISLISTKLENNGLLLYFAFIICRNIKRITSAYIQYDSMCTFHALTKLNIDNTLINTKLNGNIILDILGAETEEEYDKLLLEDIMD